MSHRMQDPEREKMKRHGPLRDHGGIHKRRKWQYLMQFDLCYSSNRFPWWLSAKEPACQCRRCGFDP